MFARSLRFVIMFANIYICICIRVVYNNISSVSICLYYIPGQKYKTTLKNEEKLTVGYVLYIDLRPGQTCHPKDSGSDTFRWQFMRAWLTIWDKVKSRGTVIDWCTGTEWPVDCMTVISVWWRSNMPFQRLSGRWNYHITRWRQEVSQFGDQFGNPLVTRCVRGSQHPAERGPPGIRLSSPGEWERDNAHGHKIRGQYIAVSVRSTTPSHSKTLSNPFRTFSNKVRGIFFKEVFARLYYCVKMYSARICIWVYNICLNYQNHI